MATRVATAIIGLPLLILVVWVDSLWFSVLVAVIAAIGALEMSGMARQWGDRPITPLAVLLAAALVLAAHYGGNRPSVSMTAPIIVLLWATLSLLWLLRRDQPALPQEDSASRWLATAGVAFFIGGLLFHAPLLRSLDQGREWVLLLLLVTFATDTSAFFVGKTIGKTPLAPAISPSKTREGAAGGVVGAVAVSFAAVYVFNLDVALWKTLAIGISIGIVGQVGDLVESRLKRISGVKDSGRLVPGHGGVLDRLDSIVFNLVVVYYFVV